jgi:hypothetical protein
MPDAAAPETSASAPHDDAGAQPQQQPNGGPSSAPSGPWEWLGPLAPWFAHLLPGVGPPPQQHDHGCGSAGGSHGGSAPGPVCDAAPARHGQLPRGVSDAIPWYRPFYWSPTTDAEAQAALDGMLPFVGCVFRVPVKGLSKSRGTCDGAGADVCLVALWSTAAVMVAQLGALLRALAVASPPPALTPFPPTRPGALLLPSGRPYRTPRTRSRATCRASP